MQRALFLIARRTEVLQFVVMVTHHLRGRVAVQNIHYVLSFMLLVDLLNRLQDQLQQLACIHFLVRLTAVVAVAAFLLVVFLTKIVQQQLAPANRALRITLRLKQQLVADTDLLRRLIFLETTQTFNIVRAVETQTVSFAAISAGTTRLLIIALQTLRDVIVYYKTHVRLVNTHSESDRSHDHLTLFHQEGILMRTTRRRVQTGMVRLGRDTVHFQHLRQILYLLASQAIYNTALAFHAPDKTYQILIHIFRLRTYFVIQVRTVKTALEYSRIRHAQVLLNIFLHLRRCRCRQRDYRRLADTLYHTADLTVLRTEIMTPFRYTMCLIYRIERDLNALQKVHVLAFVQTLRRQVQQLRLACQHVLLDRIDLAATQTRVDEVRHTIFLRVITHRIHLIFHQRNQRRDHNRHTVHHQRRQLVAQTLTATCRHQHKRVLAVNNVLDDRFLIPLEQVETKVVLQRLY